MQQMNNILLGKPDFNNKAGEAQNKVNGIKSAESKDSANEDLYLC